MESGERKMEKRGTIELRNGEYTLSKPTNKQCTKKVFLKQDKIFYGCAVKDNKIVCDDKAINGIVQVWF